jgi:hypothetical protein
MSRFGIQLTSTANGRAICRGCKQKIAKDVTAVRIIHFYSGDADFWHRDCIDEKINPEKHAAA